MRMRSCGGAFLCLCNFSFLVIGPSGSSYLTFTTAAFSQHAARRAEDARMDVSSPFAQTSTSVFYLCSAHFVVILPDVV